MTDSDLFHAWWKGFVPQSFDSLSDKELLITLSPNSKVLPCCGKCHQECLRIHDRSIRMIRDRDILDQRVTLSLPIRRVLCPECGITTEFLEWLSPWARVTNRLSAWIEVLAQLLPIRHISQLTGLHWHTIKEIDKRRLQREVGQFDATGVTHLVMDEFALHKGHRYATVIMDAQRCRVLWVGEGTSREEIRPFFELLGEQCDQIKAVAMDMNASFDLEVRAQCPQAEVVYDLFHVVAKFGREVVDRVRVDQANALREDKPARRVIKRSRWLLLRNRNNLSQEQEVKLSQLLEANQPLSTVYLLKTSLKEIWYAPTVWEGFRRWRAWYRLCRESGITVVIHFAKRLRKYIRGILSSARYRMHTSLIEGVNNKIKVIKRMAYGYRDNEYFFLKIKAAFPGIPR